MERNCINCKNTRSIERFVFDKRTDKYGNVCKECNNARRKAARSSPEVKEKERQQREEYRNRPEVKASKSQKDAEYRNKPENKQHMREYYAQYYEKNREEILRKNYENEKKRLENDVNAYLRKVLRSRLNSAIKDKSKAESTMDLLGCSINKFNKWLEYTFIDGMTWENYGQYWHIDHIKPCASYDFTIDANQKECFNWKNMRAAEAKENMSKSDTIDNDLIQKMQTLVEEFEKQYIE